MNMIHIYYGNGKGKTSAAVGLALRMLGHGKTVGILQFLKRGTSGEINLLKQFAYVRANEELAGFSFNMTAVEKEQCADYHNNMLTEVMNLTLDCVILDEVIDAYTLQLLDKQLLVDFLSKCPQTAEIVMTGHSLPRELADYAHYITEFSSVRHPYEQNIKARKGIEF